MKATDLLKKDHKTVKGLFKKFEKAKENHEKKKELFNEIHQELDIHAKIEEEIFYPAVKQAQSEDAKDIVREAIEEHKVVKTLLQEISALHPQDEQYDAKVIVLRENVEHHAEEEEDEMFKEAKKYFSKERMEELGERMEARKEELKGTLASL